MSDRHSNSEFENILSSDGIEKKLHNNNEHTEQLEQIVKSKGKLVVYLSIFYGVIILAGLIFVFIS
jgi:hypothetical protein